MIIMVCEDTPLVSKIKTHGIWHLVARQLFNSYRREYYLLLSLLCHIHIALVIIKDYYYFHEIFFPYYKITKITSPNHLPFPI